MKNIFGIEPENIDQMKAQLIFESVNDGDPEEDHHTYDFYEKDINYAWEDGKLVHENENWYPMGWPRNKYFEFTNSKRLTFNKEKKGVSETSRWKYREEIMDFHWGKQGRYYHSMFFKP